MTASRARKQKLSGGHLVIPDIHGHLSRFRVALQMAKTIPGVQLVFLGDLIDDSPRRRFDRKDYREAGVPDDSRTILQEVQHLHGAGQAQVLLGNHELMGISAVLHAERGVQELWWRHGGREMAAGYGWRGHEPVEALTHDLNWLLEHGRAWLSVGPPGKQVLLAHATRPHPQRLKHLPGNSSDLLALPEFDPVVWFGLGDELQGGLDFHPLPDGYQGSVHGHMQGTGVREISGPDSRPAIQLDLHPHTKKLAMLHIAQDGTLSPVLKAIDDRRS